MENDINMSCVIGVSAGALSGMNYVSRQIRTLRKTNLGYRHDSRYVGAKALLHSRSILDVGFLVEDRGILEPLDADSFYRPERRYIAVTTNCLTGEVTYFEKGKCTDIIRLSGPPPPCRSISPMVMIDGTPHLDGGCACKIPYQWALDQGFEKVLVIRTREVGFRKEEGYRRRRSDFTESIRSSQKSCPSTP
jgi:predicted patatin/cPLA2 family phospholipase